MPLKLETNRFLSEFSTFGIGGPIRFFAVIESVSEMEEALLFSKDRKIPFFVLGKGSNCLFDDRGFDGLVLQNKINFCDWLEGSVHVGAGYSFSLLGSQSAKKGFTGLEFASGIPGSVGGAVVMNAGANGRETVDCLQSVCYLKLDGNIIDYKVEDLKFGYRFSSFQAMEGVVLSAYFGLNRSIEAREKQLQIIDYRMKTQPLKEKSAGCIFRNPRIGLSAGAVIDQCGLKGLKVGGAKVSEVHANFIINQDQATAEDVKELIEIIQSRVYEKTGIHLESEIKIIG